MIDRRHISHEQCPPAQDWRDAGPSPALAGTSLDGGYRYWRTPSGKRLLYRVMPSDLDPSKLLDLMAQDAHVISARRQDDGRIVLWQGRTDDPDLTDALRAARRAGATELHVHVFDTASKQIRCSAGAPKPQWLSSRVACPSRQAFGEAHQLYIVDAEFAKMCDRIDDVVDVGAGLTMPIENQAVLAVF